MDLWQLKIFCHVIEQKSFSKAGKEIRLSQPTVSSHIKDLEHHFGCRLIDRLSKEAIPTRAGRLLYDYSVRLIALKDETESALYEFQGLTRGRLVVGGSSIPGGYLLPRIIGVFRRAYPDVMISLKIGDTREILEQISAGKIEIGIVGARTEEKQLIQEPLIKDKMRLILPGDHKLATRDRVGIDTLLKEPFILREGGSGTLKTIRSSLNRVGSDISDLNAVAEMGNTVAVIQGIKSRVGVSILSTIAVSEDLEKGSLKSLEIDGLNLDRHLYLTGHRHRTPSPLHGVFHRFLKSEFAEDRPAPKRKKLKKET
jgi:DNA-binding transcriptional LysR family regulator